MSDIAGEVTAAASGADGWRELNPFAITDAEGWIISRYTVMGVNKFLLWESNGKPHGPFDAITAAKSCRRSAHDTR
jgi:hypothetical protein